MSEAATGAVILAVLAVAISSLIHYRMRSVILPSIAAALLAAAAFSLIDYLHEGHLQPFAPIAFVMSLLLTLCGAIFIGILFAIARKRAREPPRAEPKDHRNR
jgi:predicted PurR-regulated permease PerM